MKTYAQGGFILIVTIGALLLVGIFDQSITPIEVAVIFFLGMIWIEINETGNNISEKFSETLNSLARMNQEISAIRHEVSESTGYLLDIREKNKGS